jgi:hypothetical protein
MKSKTVQLKMRPVKFSCGGDVEGCELQDADAMAIYADELGLEMHLADVLKGSGAFDDAVKAYSVSTRTSLMEVVVDIAVNCGAQIAADNITIVDSRSIPSTVIELAEAFEEKYKGTEWGEELDYIEIVDEYSEAELRRVYPVKR